MFLRHAEENRGESAAVKNRERVAIEMAALPSSDGLSGFSCCPDFSCPCKKLSLRFFMTVSRDEHIKFEAVACYQ
jgi:hypothetical protein